MVREQQDGEPKEVVFSFLKHLDRLEELFNQQPQINLLICDPLAAFTGGLRNPFDSSEVRAAMAPLVSLLAKHSIAMVFIMHLNKAEGLSALHRFSGSGAWTQVSRTAWMVDKDPQAPNRRLFLPVKSNIGQDTHGFAFTIESEGQHPKILWEGGAISMNADQWLSQRQIAPNKVELAEEWLLKQLSNGNKLMAELEDKAEQDGHSWKTVLRAKKSLSVESRKTEWQGRWEWHLPEGTSDINSLTP